MPSATFVLFDAAIGRIGDATIDLDGHTFKAMITNTPPNRADDMKADITEISAGNGYSAGGVTLGSVTWSQIAGSPQGTWLFDCANFVWTASGGSIGPGRYVVVYDDTSSNDDLLGYLDYGSSFTITDGNTLTGSVPNGLFLGGAV